jgi:HD-like signal output (HDOD) protein
MRNRPDYRLSVIRRTAGLAADLPVEDETTVTDDKAQQEMLRNLLAGAQLPALPQSAIRVVELAKDPDNGPAEFAIPIESEPGLTSQVLRFVNSSYFGFPREISSVKLAITLVGIRTIKNFVLWSAVYNMMPNPRCGGLDLNKLWQDSLRRGLFARTLGKAIGLKDTEEPFAAALLQDMAIPLLAKQLPDDYSRFFEAREGGTVRLSILEDEQFGWTHGDAAYQIAEMWNLPSEFASLVAHHTQWEPLREDLAVDQTQLVIILSSLLPASVDERWVEQPDFDALVHQWCGHADSSPRVLLAAVDDQFLEFAPTLNLAASARPLVDYYDDEVALTTCSEVE